MVTHISVETQEVLLQSQEKLQARGKFIHLLSTTTGFLLEVTNALPLISVVALKSAVTASMLVMLILSKCLVEISSDIGQLLKFADLVQTMVLHSTVSPTAGWKAALEHLALAISKVLMLTPAVDVPTGGKKESQYHLLLSDALPKTQDGCKTSFQTSNG